jgi:hypothetical protein
MKFGEVVTRPSGEILYGVCVNKFVMNGPFTIRSLIVLFSCWFYFEETFTFNRGLSWFNKKTKLGNLFGYFIIKGQKVGTLPLTLLN